MDDQTPRYHDLSDDEQKQLRALHPLYSKLTGAVIWGLYEEQGYTGRECGERLDAELARMAETFSLMHRLRHIAQDASNGRRAFLYYSHQKDACPGCNVFAGKSFQVPKKEQDWLPYLPPFAVGCGLRCSLNVHEEYPQALPLEVQPKPRRELLCPLLAKAGE